MKDALVASPSAASQSLAQRRSGWWGAILHHAVHRSDVDSQFQCGSTGNREQLLLVIFGKKFNFFTQQFIDGRMMRKIADRCVLLFCHLVQLMGDFFHPVTRIRKNQHRFCFGIPIDRLQGFPRDEWTRLTTRVVYRDEQIIFIAVHEDIRMARAAEEGFRIAKIFFI